MATFAHGTSGRVTINGTNWNVTQWSATEERAELETTNSESGGFFECITSYVKLTGTAELVIDLDNLPYDSAMGMDDGSAVAAEMHLATTTGPSYSSATAYVTQQGTTNQRGTVVSMTVNFTFSGSYTRPT